MSETICFTNTRINDFGHIIQGGSPTLLLQYGMVVYDWPNNFDTIFYDHFSIYFFHIEFV